MQVEFRDGLLLVSISIVYKGIMKLIDDIVIDTGAANSIISPDALDELGIVFTPEDPVVISYGIGGKQYAFVKRIDRVVLGNFSISDFNLDFGVIDPDNRINGLLGLNLKKLWLAFNEG